jgi:hypothetical protein
MAVKQNSFEEFVTARKALLTRHAEELADLDQLVTQAAKREGFHWAPLNERRRPGMAKAKQAFHDRNRAEAIDKGYLRPDGSPDLERLRLEKKAAGLGISVPALVRLEANEKAKRAQEKFKTVKNMVITTNSYKVDNN